MTYETLANMALSIAGLLPKPKNKSCDVVPLAKACVEIAYALGYGEISALSRLAMEDERVSHALSALHYPSLSQIMRESIANKIFLIAKAKLDCM